jgi:hypothetical protein
MANESPRSAFDGSYLRLRSSPQVIENCPVTGITVREDETGVRRVRAVETEHGTIETACVVNCAGESRSVGIATRVRPSAGHGEGREKQQKLRVENALISSIEAL